MNEQVSSMQQDYEAFLKKHDLDIDTHFYTQDEWQARGEPFGNNAELSLTFEGALYHLLNYHGGELADAFYAIAGKYGYYVDLGYAWSAHFYKL
jgi:hypothetical protein